MSALTETLDAETTLGPSGAEASAVNESLVDGLTQGAAVGRYVVLRRLGAGGMGTVYLAYDPELDRKVAIKLLRGPTTWALPLTLQREAQAMAKLQHPNVVTVYDVGEHHGRVYVAMEVVEGRTLREWVKAERRGWRELLEVFSSAGRGVVAAHERGLIHRDFKPDNVMVCDEGRRVVVMDFGLARASQDSTHDDPDLDLLSYRGPVIDAATVGRLVGTPAYMAPEQFSAHVPTPAVDQFAFCVSLWEAVCGERPFEGEYVAELYVNASEGRIRSPPAAAHMPGWLRRALARGLAPEPTARWPSMAALLDELERGRGRGRRTSRLLAIATMVAIVGTTWAWQRQQALARREALAACEAEGAVIDEVWNDETRAQLREGMLATGARFAPASLELLEPWLDAYHGAWSRGRTEACVHATIEHDWDEERVDRSSWCFEDRRLQLEATVEQLSTLDKAAARRAVRIASYLDPMSTCLDPNLLQRLPTPPIELRSEIRAIRAALSEADGLRHSGRYTEAREVVTPARERAEALGWSPLVALARLTEGRCLLEDEQYAHAEGVLVRAYFEAQGAGSLEVAFRSARSLMWVYRGLQRFREAEVWSRHADVLSVSLDDLGGLDAAEGHYLRSQIHLGLHDYETAAAEGAEAVAMRTKTLGSEHPITAAATRNLGMIYLALGRFREALECFVQAYVVWQDAAGPEHPYVADLAMYRGKALWELGYVDEALGWLEQGLAVHERSVHAEHPDTLRNLDELGRVLLALGRVDEAEPMLARVMASAERRGVHHSSFATSLLAMAEVDAARGREAQALERCARALEILERALEPEHPDHASARGRIAAVHRALGRYDDAAALGREALRRYEAIFGSTHQRLMSPLVGLGATQLAAAQLDQAHRSYAGALAIGEQALGPDDAALVPSLTGLAEVALAGGNPDAARPLAERAVQLSDDEDVGPRLAAGAHFVLARTLGALAESPARARALSEQARQEYASHHHEARVAEVERWQQAAMRP